MLTAKFAKIIHREHLNNYSIFNELFHLYEYCGLGGLVISALDFHAGYRGFESR